MRVRTVGSFPLRVPVIPVHSVEGRIVTELLELPSSTIVSTVQWSCNQHLRVCSSQMGKCSLDTVYISLRSRLTPYSCI